MDFETRERITSAEMAANKAHALVNLLEDKMMLNKAELTNRDLFVLRYEHDRAGMIVSMIYDYLAQVKKYLKEDNYER